MRFHRLFIPRNVVVCVVRPVRKTWKLGFIPAVDRRVVFSFFLYFILYLKKKKKDIFRVQEKEESGALSRST